MRAAVYRKGSFVLDSIPSPSPTAGQVLIEIVATGICGSDLSAAKHTRQFLESAKHSGTDLYSFDPDRDLVFGHEYAGKVLEVGDGVKNVTVGDMVAGIAIVNDPGGVPRLCGYSNDYTGGFAEQMVIQADWLHLIPAGLDPALASLAEPLSVGETSAQRSGITSEQGAVVLGAGSVGLGVIAALRARGVSEIIVVEPSRRRREVAERMGATVVLHPDEGDPVDLWRKRTINGSPLVAWECTGKPAMINKLMYSAPPKTRIMVDGSCMVDDTIRPVVGTYKGLLVDFGFGDAVDAYPISLARIASGAIDAAALITGEVGLDRVGEAFAELGNPNEHVKILVRPSATV